MMFKKWLESNNPISTFQAITDKIMERYDLLTPCDVVNGHCQQWAELANKRIPKSEIFFLEHNDIPHAVIFLAGLYYDAETPQGVRDYRQLPIFNRPRGECPEN